MSRPTKKPYKMGEDGHIISCPDPLSINATAFSMVCVKNNGHNNFKIMTIRLVNGIVEDIQYSDPYGSFEFNDQLDTITSKACDRINMHWKEGSCLI